MWCYTLFPKILNMSLTAGIVIVLVMLARLPLKKAPKIFSYALWAVVLFRLLCPISFSSDFSLLGAFHDPTVTNGSIAYIPADIVHTTNPQVDLPLPCASKVINESLPQGAEQTGADPLEAPMAIATLLWLGGIVAMLVYSVISLLLLRRTLVGAVRLRANIYLADHIATPFVMGVIRPKIYLPSALSGQEQEYIILHEQTHIQRLDHIVKLVAFLALALHWFNPLVWAAFILSGKDMEMSCDESVMGHMDRDIRREYSTSLLSLATGRKIISGIPLAFGEDDTKSRIKNVLRYKKPAFWIVVVAAVTCIVLTVCLLANPRTYSLERQPQPEIKDQDDYSEAVEIAMKSVKPEEVVVEDTGSNEKTALAWMEAWFDMLKALPDDNMAHISDGTVDRLKVIKISKEGLTQAFVFSVTFSIRPTYPIVSNAFWMAGNTGNSPGRDETWGQMSQEVELRLGDDGRYHFVSKGTGGVGSLEVYDDVRKDMILTSADEGDDEQNYLVPNEAAERLVAIFYGSTMQKTEVFPENVAHYTFYYGEDSFSINGNGGTLVWAKIDQQLYLFDLFTEELAEVNQIIKLTRTYMESEQDEPWELIGKADVNRDGREEIFYLDKSHIASGSWVTLRVCDSSYNEIWSEQAGTPHVGWNSLFLCEHDGEYCLLRYHPTMYQGYCTYVYALFTLEGGAEHAVRSNTIEFDINGINKLDAPKMVVFAEEVNALLRKSTLLLSSEGGNYSFGPSSADQFFERYSWLDETPELYTDGDDLETRLVKYSEYAVANHR